MMADSNDRQKLCDSILKIVTDYLSRCESEDPDSSIELVVESILESSSSIERAKITNDPGNYQSRLSDQINKRLLDNASFRRECFRLIGKPYHFLTPVATVFVSYSKDDSADLVFRLVYELQKFRGIRVVYDEISVASGVLDSELGGLILQSHVFVLILQPGVVDKLKRPDNWVRREIETAISLKKRIIPVLVGDMKMPDAQSLPASIRFIRNCPGVRLHRDGFSESVKRLVSAFSR